MQQFFIKSLIFECGQEQTLNYTLKSSLKAKKNQGEYQFHNLVSTFFLFSWHSIYVGTGFCMPKFLNIPVDIV